MSREVFQKIAEHNPIHQMYGQGFMPSDVKNLVVETLKPYFRSENNLRSMDVGMLGTVAVNVGKISLNVVSEKLLKATVQHFWNALDADQESSLATCGFWEEAVVRAGTEFWSIFRLELVKDELPLEEFRVEIFRNIGSLIEACLKPVLGHLLSQIRVSQGNRAPSSDVAKLDLGQVIEALHKVFGNAELTAPSPWGIRLNQWRNIAQHHSSFIRNGKIVGTYGKTQNKKEVVLERPEALNVARRIAENLRVLNTARVLYMLENGEPLLKHLPNVEFREEWLQLKFAAAVATQGFVVEDFHHAEHLIQARVSDQTSQPWLERFVHSSQFIFFLWNLMGKDRVEIRFTSKDMTHQASAWAAGEDLARIAKADDPMKELAGIIHFEPSLHGAIREY